METVNLLRVWKCGFSHFNGTYQNLSLSAFSKPACSQESYWHLPQWLLRWEIQWKPSNSFVPTTIKTPLMSPLYFWQRLTSECACSPAWDCPLRETSFRIAQWRRGTVYIENLQADWDVSRRLTKMSRFCDVQQSHKHSLHSNLAMECLLNYCVLKL